MTLPTMAPVAEPELTATCLQVNPVSSSSRSSSHCKQMTLVGDAVVADVSLLKCFVTIDVLLVTQWMQPSMIELQLRQVLELMSQYLPASHSTSHAADGDVMSWVTVLSPTVDVVVVVTSGLDTVVPLGVETGWVVVVVSLWACNNHDNNHVTVVTHKHTLQYIKVRWIFT